VKVAAALLAAGASTRLGRPKALLEWRGATFVRRLATELAAVASPVLVVAPPKAGPIAAELSGTGARVVVNPRAARGLGGSLAIAARALETFGPEADALLVALVDQPLAGRELFASLVAAAESGSGWAASDYGDGPIGPPALFPRAAFEELRSLSGERGARALLEHERERLALVPFADGRHDIDTEADFARLAADPHLLGEE